tara:strand:+ start:8021 stop:8758 length:738 start_codon:yes stop_codon:yes gene_type:complete
MWQQGTIVGRIDWTDHLFSLKIQASVAPFEAGQFIKLSQLVDDKRIARAYSLINAPDESTLEVLVTYVQGGQLSPYLHQLQLGDMLDVSVQASGFLVLSELPAASSLLFLATGSGIGPFLSMMRAGDIQQQFRRIALAYGVRKTADLAYADELESWMQALPEQFSWCPCVTREPDYSGLTQRIPQLIEQGELEKQLNMPIEPPDLHVLLCGNPGLITEGTEILKHRGLEKHRRRKPGHISVEKYW